MGVGCECFANLISLCFFIVFGSRVYFLLGSRPFFVNEGSVVSCDLSVSWEEVSSVPSTLPSHLGISQKLSIVFKMTYINICFYTLSKIKCLLLLVTCNFEGVQFLRKISFSSVVKERYILANLDAWPGFPGGSGSKVSTCSAETRLQSLGWK